MLSVCWSWTWSKTAAAAATLAIANCAQLTATISISINRHHIRPIFIGSCCFSALHTWADKKHRLCQLLTLCLLSSRYDLLANFTVCVLINLPQSSLPGPEFNCSCTSVLLLLPTFGPSGNTFFQTVCLFAPVGFSFFVCRIESQPHVLFLSVRSSLLLNSRSERKTKLKDYSLGAVLKTGAPLPGWHFWRVTPFCWLARFNLHPMQVYHANNVQLA